MSDTSKRERHHEDHRSATGPKTARGKAISSRNARKHGLLSKELIVSAEDKPALEHLRCSLRDELKTSSFLLTMLIEDVVVSYWDLMMCIRRKNEYLKGTKEEPAAVNSSSNLSVADLRGDWNTQRRLRLLQELRQDVAATGWISDRWKEALITAFGQPFYSTLMQWHATEGIYLMLTEILIKKDVDLPGSRTESQIAAAADKQAALEAPLRRAAVMKLIDMQEQLLVSQASIQAGFQSVRSDPLELYQRYETTARRNLHRAIREYMDVKRDLECLTDE